MQKRAERLKQMSQELGFTACGVAKADFLAEEAPKLENWLRQNYHGKMAYMERYFDIRLDPRKLVEGAKSVICLMYNYFPKKDLSSVHGFKISKYAYGEDYHFVLKDKMKELVTKMQIEFGNFQARIFTDSAPIMERPWAQRAGLGWQGKNSLLLSKQKGSFFFLAEIVTDLEIQPDPPFQADHCGECTRCIDACPTQAIVKPYVVDANKCISYLTIELKEEIDKQFHGKMENWIFGCDICQDVCPWNRFATPHCEPRFEPNEEFEKMTKQDWMEITEEVFQRIFKKSAVKRTKISGLRRNMQANQ
ncbi:MAG: tRNA epoxyqueuosine(34) reductase QueG [Cytophagales bacterium]|nr:tRNA epoxyqueuosine(34) reductase QueG [Cytophagales bacterium]MDW8383914.1 tRNA epoxyqueuosine(34) reductase QueG [Flammeovirgaceae bacterium]